MAQEGVRDNQSLTLLRITPIDEGGGRIDKENCQNVLGSLLNPAALSPWSETLLAAGCKVVHGNSGSPVLNWRNQVVGIMQAFVDDKFRNEVDARLAKINVEVPPMFPNGIFTNMSCIPHPVKGSNGFAEGQCEISKELEFSDWAPGEEDFKQGWLDLYEEWKKDLPSEAIFYMFWDKKRQMFSFQPICLMPTQDERQELSFVYFKLAIFELSLRIDPYYRFLAGRLYDTAVEVLYQVQLERQGQQWVGNETRWPEKFGQPNVPEKLELPTCSAQQVERGHQGYVQAEDGRVYTKEEYDNLN